MEPMTTRFFSVVNPRSKGDSRVGYELLIDFTFVSPGWDM
ncbi:hypothetical protein MA5S0422_1295 [Mycobacteroides abscessus 5S-0422]|nr:hypothetical protein MA5S0422_1295 [Mycobacteroides abscessus 5S-0422]CPU34740.1 Uncharacterised protein [Mycobacteroides abscessus]SHT88264.1 Uncharacterised protein [Mycobacteroides abscessus subsp. abscessus]SHU55366.1 Uncharacterised protein [Mycobacteroides abscessus subsp. abscessus]SHW36032.1 Uncharacterised protein [Mycobacteroides abscessus subsp. abscessus]